MFEISGRKIKVSTGTKSQTVNICTSSNVHGRYESVIRLRPPFITENFLRDSRFRSSSELATYLISHHNGQIEHSKGAIGLVREDTRAVCDSELTEKIMALETRQLFASMGLKSRFRVHVCSGVVGSYVSDDSDHHLPLYTKQIQTCFTDAARQIACPDLIVIDSENRIVEVIVEFEIDTNPKNLIGNYFYVFLAEQYKSNGVFYQLNGTRTTHFLLACLKRRRAATRKEQVAIEKGNVVAEWLGKTGKHLVSNEDFCKIRAAYAFAGDDWRSMKEALRQQLERTSPHLFA